MIRGAAGRTPSHRRERRRTAQPRRGQPAREGRPVLAGLIGARAMKLVDGALGSRRVERSSRPRIARHHDRSRIARAGGARPARSSRSGSARSTCGSRGCSRAPSRRCPVHRYRGRQRTAHRRARGAGAGLEPTRARGDRARRAAEAVGRDGLARSSCLARHGQQRRRTVESSARTRSARTAQGSSRVAGGGAGGAPCPRPRHVRARARRARDPEHRSAGIAGRRPAGHRVASSSPHRIGERPQEDGSRPASPASRRVPTWVGRRAAGRSLPRPRRRRRAAPASRCVPTWVGRRGWAVAVASAALATSGTGEPTRAHVGRPRGGAVVSAASQTSDAAPASLTGRRAGPAASPTGRAS